jgi:hypothetical protein
MEQRSFDAPSSGNTGPGNTSGGSSSGSGGFGGVTRTGEGMTGGPTGTGYGSSTDTGSQLKEQGRRIADQAAGQIKTRLADVTEERKSQATGALEAVGRALRTAGENLQGEGLDPVGQLGIQAADQVDRMADYLRRRDVTAMMRDVQGAARNHPEVFLGGALLAGILIGRFLRSSAPPTHEVVFEPDFALEQGGGSSFGDGYGSSDLSRSSSGDRPPQGGWA